MACAVLIIEDERVLAKNLSTYLAREGYEAEAVESGPGENRELSA